MAIEIQMILSAIIIIYVGAHSSLRRPPSAAPPAITHKTKRTKDGKPVNEEKDEFLPGLEAMDAIMFPLMASVVLIGLYYLIKWLEDPAILNTILRGYISITGVVGTGTLLGNAMQVILSFVFPDYWLDRSGSIWTIDTRRRGAITSSADGRDLAMKTTPLPGLASKLPLSPQSSQALFTIRHLLMEDWHVKINIFGIGEETIAYKLTTLIGFALGAILQGCFLYYGGNILSNIMGLSVCYMAFMLMSVTSFAIGSYVLGGLFIYDIVMVFYTPFMIGVATQIDAPIKLSFKTSTRSSMLGLGDIVLPGIFICLALRFDLWMHYRRQIKQVDTELTTVSKVDVAAEDSNAATTKEVSTVTTVARDVKAPFVDPRGQWGNYFWTTSWRNLLAGRGPSAQAIASSAFPKTYFYATLGGYLIGMLATIGVLLYFKHGQPALLYLVPGVIGSVYFTGLRRGELKELAIYTENGSLDTKEVVVDLDGDGQPIAATDLEPSKGAVKDDRVKDVVARDDAQREDYEIFLFSVTLPREESLPKDEKME